MNPTDHLIIGAGVIGLSVGYELATRGHSVRILERGRAGKQTSWAAAGILPAIPATGQGRDAFEQLRNLSGRMFPEWLERLREDSTVDVEHDAHGAIHLASGPAEAAALAVELAEWREQGLEFRSLNADAAAQLEPALTGPAAEGRIHAAYQLPGESVLKTTRYLEALIDACRKRGVEIIEDCEITNWQFDKDRISAVQAGDDRYVANQYCMTSGVWSGATAEAWGLSLDIRPWRGQMLLLDSEPGKLSHVLNEGPKYLVPRRDGRILIGSTVEDVGFHLATTDEVIDDLLLFASRWIPSLAQADTVAQWAGLRPGTGDGWPYLGRVRQTENAFVAAGHFRSGIFLSPITATVMSQTMLGEPTSVDLNDFRMDRK